MNLTRRQFLVMSPSIATAATAAMVCGAAAGDRIGPKSITLTGDVRRDIPEVLRVKNTLDQTAALGAAAGALMSIMPLLLATHLRTNFISAISDKLEGNSKALRYIEENYLDRRAMLKILRNAGLMSLAFGVGAELIQRQFHLGGEPNYDKVMQALDKQKKLTDLEAELFLQQFSKHDELRRLLANNGMAAVLGFILGMNLDLLEFNTDHSEQIKQIVREARLYSLKNH